MQQHQRARRRRGRRRLVQPPPPRLSLSPSLSWVFLDRQGSAYKADQRARLHRGLTQSSTSAVSLVASLTRYYGLLLSDHAQAAAAGRRADGDIHGKELSDWWYAEQHKQAAVARRVAHSASPGTAFVWEHKAFLRSFHAKSSQSEPERLFFASCAHTWRCCCRRTWSSRALTGCRVSLPPWLICTA
jgi:hypothetical protein